MIKNGSEDKIDGLQDDPFYLLPPELIQKILTYCPFQTTFVCKLFKENISSALKFDYWNSLKKDQNYPASFRDKFVQIENSIPEVDRLDGCKLIRAFFRSLYRPYNLGPIKMFDFPQLGDTLLKAWQADKDDNLLQCWSKIASHLNLQIPLKNAYEIRLWMNLENNQNILAQISELNLRNLRLTNLPPEIMHFTGLKTLNLDGNELTTLPETIGNLTKLEILLLSDNELTTLPKTIENLVALYSLQLDRNQLKELPEKIWSLVALIALNLSDNQIEALPDNIENLVALTALNLSDNQIEALPDNIENLVVLTDLDVSNNQLKAVPETIVKLTALTYLRLSNNQLETVPDAIGNLVGLEVLDLSANQLEALPETIGKLAALEYLDLSNNKLTALPLELAEIGKNANFKPEITLKDNLLLLVPNCVLDRFKENDDIDDFIYSLKNQKLNSPSGFLLQFIRKNSDAILNNQFTEIEALGKLLDKALGEFDRMIIYLKMSKGRLGNEDHDWEWVEKNRFNDIPLFVSALGTLFKKK